MRERVCGGGWSGGKEWEGAGDREGYVGEGSGRREEGGEDADGRGE